MSGDENTDWRSWIDCSEVYDLPSATAAIEKLNKLNHDNRREVLRSSSLLLAVFEVQQIEAARGTMAENPVSLLLELLTPEDLHYIASDPQLFCTSYLHGLVRSRDFQFIKSVVKSFPTQQRVQILATLDWRGNTLLHSAVFGASSYAVKSLLDLAMNADSPSAAADDSISYSSTVPSLRYRHTRDNSLSDHMQRLLSHQNSSGCTFLMLISEYGSANQLRQIIHSLPSHTLLDLLRLKNHQYQTCLHVAARNQKHEDILTALIQYITQLPCLTPDIRELLLERDVTERTFLHSAVLRDSSRLVTSVLDQLPADSETVCSLMLATDMWDRTVLHYAASSHEPDGKDCSSTACSSTVVSALLSFLAEHLSPSDMDEMFLATDRDGHTFLHSAAAQGSLSVLHDIVAALPPKTAAKMALMTDNQSRRPSDLTRGAKQDLLHKLMMQEKTIPIRVTSPKILVHFATRKEYSKISYAIKTDTRTQFSEGTADWPTLSVTDIALIVFYPGHGCCDTSCFTTDPAEQTKSPPKMIIIQSCGGVHDEKSVWSSALTSDDSPRTPDLGSEPSVIQLPMLCESWCRERRGSSQTDGSAVRGYLPDRSAKEAYFDQKEHGIVSYGDECINANSLQRTDELCLTVHKLVKLISLVQSDKPYESKSEEQVVGKNQSIDLPIRHREEDKMPLHQACSSWDSKTVTSILESVVTDLSTSLRKILLSSSTDDSSLSQNCLLSFLDLLSTSQKIEMLKASDSNDRTVLRTLIANQQSSDDLLQKFLKYAAECREVLGMTDHDGSTVLHLLAEFGSSNQLSALLTNLDTELLIKLMKCRDKRGRTPLLRSVRNKRHHDVLVCIINILVKDSEDVLLDTDLDGCCFLHYVCESDQIPANIFSSIPPSTLAQLLRVRDRRGRTILHVAVTNKFSGHQAISALLQFIRQRSGSDLQSVLLSEDCQGSSLLHLAARFGSEAVVRDLVTKLPSRVAERLASTENLDGKIPADLTKPYSMERDLIQQVGSYSCDFYPLESAPKVLIFYTTKNRQTGADGSGQEAEMERVCVEEFVREKNFRCDVRKDPTCVEIYSSISDALSDSGVSCLIVFLMTHGQNGVVSVSSDRGGGEDFMMVEDIITHMSRMDGVKPKALIVQACQTDQQTPATATDMRHRDPVVGGCAMKRSVVLKRPDFLLFLAAATGSWALRNLMIPSLVESLRELRPIDCVSQAFVSTIAKIRRTEPDQIPLLQSTLQRRLCLGKEFPAIIDTDVGYGEVAIESQRHD